jgi:hypothetical protein
MRRSLFAASVVIVIACSVSHAQLKHKAPTVPIEVFQVLDLPLNIHEAVLEEKDSGYLIRCRMSNDSPSEIRGLRYSLTAIDGNGVSIPIANRLEGIALQVHNTNTFTFATPLRFKLETGSRFVLMLEQVSGADAIWEVIKAKDALDFYLKGDYSIQPSVMRVGNQVDAPLPLRVIY